VTRACALCPFITMLSADVAKGIAEALAELKATAAAVSATVARRAIVRPMSDASPSGMETIREAMGIFLVCEASHTRVCS